MAWWYIWLHLQHICFSPVSGTFWLKTCKTELISLNISFQSLSVPPQTQLPLLNNPLNIDSQDASNIYMHSLSLSQASNGIKVTPTLMLEEHGMHFQVMPCLSDPWHFIPRKACNKPNDIIYLCLDQTLSQTTVFSSKEKLQLLWILHEVC